MSRADPSTDPFPLPSRPYWWLQFFKSHPCSLSEASITSNK
jgi:hypothetical protein